MEQLEKKDKESEALHGELREIVHTTRAVKDIVHQVRDTDTHNFLSVLTPLIHTSRRYLSLLIDWDVPSARNCCRCLTGKIPLHPILKLSSPWIQSLGCLHVACCACIINSFQHHGVQCPICWQPCTQIPTQDVAITGILSFTYKLHQLEEPTFALLGLDPNVFVRHFSSPGQPLENHQGDIQPQPQVIQKIASTPRQDEQDVGGRDGVVSSSVNQPIDTGGVGGVADAIASVGDTVANGKILAVGLFAGTAGVLGEDINMEDGNV